LTTTWPNSGLRRQLDLGDAQAPLDLAGVVGAASDQACALAASSDGGAMNT